MKRVAMDFPPCHLIQRWRVALALAFSLSSAAASDPGWLPGPSHPDATTGLSVDTARRNAVVAFWHYVYAASKGYEKRIGWTGTYSGCNAGTTARRFQDDVQRRVNFMRALAGLDGSVRLNDGSAVYVDGHYNPTPTVLRSAAAQQAALMMSKHRDSLGRPVVTHMPAPDFICFTPEAGNACWRGNLTYGFFGAGAIDAYMRENVAGGDTIWSGKAGHRRWILLPGATSFATGDTPGDGGSYQATNVLYVVQPPSERAKTAARFTAWPAPGYFPGELNTRVWSLSYPHANFANATVSMSGPSGTVSVTILDRTNVSYGDPAIIWQIPAEVGAGVGGEDKTYHVTVSGIGGTNVPASHSYTVTLINVNRLGESMALTGCAEPPPSGANYFFDPVDLAESRRVEIGRRAAAKWIEGAEVGTTEKIVDGTAQNYSLCSSMSAEGYDEFWRSGARAFRLAFPYNKNPPCEDWFRIDRDLVTGAGAEMHLYFKRGYSCGSRVLIETSVDGGLNWQKAGQIAGRTDYYADESFSSLSVPLPPNQMAVRVRFRHVWTGDVFFSAQGYPGSPVGIFIDDIKVSGAEEIVPMVTRSLDGDAGMFRFDSEFAGGELIPGEEYLLRVGASIANHEFPFGPVKDVTVSGALLDGFSGWTSYDYPLLACGFDGDDDGDGMDNGVEYAFGTNPLRWDANGDRVEIDTFAGVFRLRRTLVDAKDDIVYSAETSVDLEHWTEAGVEIGVEGGELTAEIPMDAQRRFLRWRVTRR